MLYFKFIKKSIGTFLNIILLLLLIACSNDDSVKCPAPSFVSFAKNEIRGSYVFVANFSTRNSDLFAWYLDGEPKLIAFSDDDFLDTDDGNAFYANNLPVGSHEICIKTQKTGYCPDGVLFCETIIVPEKNDCETMDFLVLRDEGEIGGYTFVADFESKNNIDYGWYIDNKLIKSEMVADFDRTHQVNYTFESSYPYNVCIRSLAPSCPLSSVACKLINVDLEEFCPTAVVRFLSVDDEPDMIFVIHEFKEEIPDTFRLIFNDVEIPKENITISNENKTFNAKLERMPGRFNFFPNKKDCPAEYSVVTDFR